MSVSDHLKQASAELMKAAELLKIEIDSLRKEEVSSQRELQNYISRLLVEIQHHESEARRLDDPQLSTQHQATVAQLQKEVADKRAQLRQMQRDIESAIQQKTGMVSGLESQANSIRP